MVGTYGWTFHCSMAKHALYDDFEPAFLIAEFIVVPEYS